MISDNAKPVIVALDFPSEASCLALVDQLDPALCRLKVGKEMFTRYGPSWVETLQSRGFELFLDLKFHDIPNTVAAALRVAADLGVWMVNVHASGGRKMLTASAQALSGYQQRPLLTAVTVLTSLSDGELAEVGIPGNAQEQVTRLAALAADCGVDGVVCSALEAALVKNICGESFLTVTPGIRPRGADLGDQTRVMTPERAIANGVDYMVIGRPITQSADPIATLTSIHQSLGL
jgi:orotidine-5'-phosphate decarboxylase